VPPTGLGITWVKQNGYGKYRAVFLKENNYRTQTESLIYHGTVRSSSIFTFLLVHAFRYRVVVYDVTLTDRVRR